MNQSFCNGHSPLNCPFRQPDFGGRGGCQPYISGDTGGQTQTFPSNAAMKIEALLRLLAKDLAIAIAVELQGLKVFS